MIFWGVHTAWRRLGILFVILISAMHVATAPAAESTGERKTMTVASPAFSDGEAIPREFTCDGTNVSPALTWSSVPAGTQSFALICDDPDAPGGTWVHWVYYDIPATRTELPKGVSADTHPDTGGIQGTNDFRRPGYGGPCPPGGSHRYYFKLYALDAVLDLSPGATKRQLLQAMNGHILARGEMMGTYSR